MTVTKLFERLVLILLTLFIYRMSNAQVLKIEDEFVSLSDVFRGNSTTTKIIIKNVGNKELVIDKVVSGCPCLRATSSKSYLSPGEMGILELAYEPEAKTGTVRHLAYILSNDSSSRIKAITLKAEISPILALDPENIVIDLSNSSELNNVLKELTVRNIWKRPLESIEVRSLSPYVMVHNNGSNKEVEPGDARKFSIVIDRRLIPEKNHSAVIIVRAKCGQDKIDVIRKVTVLVKKTSSGRYDEEEVWRDIRRGWSWAPEKIVFQNNLKGCLAQECLVRFISTDDIALDQPVVAMAMSGMQVKQVKSMDCDAGKGMQCEYLVVYSPQNKAAKSEYSIFSAHFKKGVESIRKYLSVQVIP